MELSHCHFEPLMNPARQPGGVWVQPRCPEGRGGLLEHPAGLLGAEGIRAGARYGGSSPAPAEGNVEMVPQELEQVECSGGAGDPYEHTL